MHSDSAQTFTAVTVAALLAGALAVGLHVATSASPAPVSGRAPQPIALSARPSAALVAPEAGDHEDLVQRMAPGFPLEWKVTRAGQPPTLTMMPIADMP